MEAMAFLSPLPLQVRTSVRTDVHSTTPRRPRVASISLNVRCTASPHHPHDATPAPAPPPSPPPASTPTTRKPLTRPNLALILTVLTLPFVPLLKPLLKKLTTLATTLPPLRAASLIAITNFFTVLLCFPANMALMIAAGALLGPLPAFIALFTSKLLAATAAFLLSRKLFQHRVEKLLDTRPRLAKILRGDVAGWKFVLLMRLSPFPGFMLNYLLSLTAVPFWEYIIGTTIGTLPSVLNLVLVGDAARDVGAGIGGGGLRGGLLGLFIRVACAVSMILVTAVGARKVRKVFKEYGEGIEVAESQ